MIKITVRHKKEKLKTGKKRTKSSAKWLQRQLNDPYVLEAKEHGYRSRASFKIIEIDEKFKIFKKNQKVLDLGCAPGGWSQIIVDKVGKNNVLGVDLLETEPIEGVKFIQKNFLDEDAKKIILENMDTDKFDVVVSDMAANTTGEKRTDHLRTTLLLEDAVNFAIKVLKNGGCFIAKTFQGGAEKEILDILKKHFEIVKHFKPKSSRKNSVENYLVAKNFKN